MLEKFTVIPPFTILLGDFHLDFRHKLDGDYRYLFLGKKYKGTFSKPAGSR